jgi:iron complex outermembrane receptor protein
MRETSIRRGLGALVLAFAVCLAGDPLAAQSETPPGAAPAPPAEAQADEAEPETVLDAIVVTAQKREENVQDVPISMSTFNAEQMQLLTAGGADVKFLSGRVPSLILESSFGRAFPRFYIRGLGNTDFDLNASQPVSMVVDEIVLENPVVKGMPLFDLERTEVLRGPQGTFFGRNTPAGVVKFDTKKPTQESEGFFRASYGTFDNIDVQAAYGGGITETFSARAAVLYQSQSDWVDNGHTGEKNALGGFDTTAARVQFLWEPNDSFDALLNLHGWSLNGTARIFRANILKQSTNDLADGFEQDQVFQDGLNEQTIDAYGGSFKFDYDFGNAVLTSITGYETISKMYSRGDIDGGFGCAFCGLPNGPGFVPFPAETADGIPDLDQWTQELRVASDDGGTWDYLVGFYYFDESLRVDSFGFNSLAPGNPPNGDFSFQVQDSTSWALFASLDFRPTDRWTLKGGLRYTTDEKDFAADRPSGPTPTIRPIVETTDANQVTWDLSAVYEVTDSANVYGRLATGFRAPSIQGRIGFCPSDTAGGTDPETDCVSVADAEKITSFEIGLKTDVSSKLRLNADVYTYEMTDQQLVAVGGQANIATLINADKTKGYGFEASLDFAPSQYWLITMGASYNNTDIDDPSLGVFPCGGGCTVTDPIIGGQARIDGNPLPNAPEWIFDGIVDFRTPVGSGLFFASFDWAYQSEKNFFLYESKEFKADSLELGLRAGYTFAEAKYEVALFVRNLTDEEIVQGAIDFNNLTGMTNEPRMIGLEFSTRF